MEDDEDWKPMVYLVHPEKFDAVAQSFVGKVLDSSRIDGNGRFQFDEPEHLQDTVVLEIVVQKKGEKYPNRLMNVNPKTDNYFPLIFQSRSNVVIHANISNFQASFVIEQPSPLNNAMLELRDLRLEAFQKYLNGEENEHGSEGDLLEKEKELYQFQEKLIGFAEDTEELLPAMMALRWASPEGNYERIAELVHNQSEKWRKLYPEHFWVKELASVADKQNLPILVGDVVPDIELPSPNGKSKLLKSTLNHNQLTILDVWASWCAPCRLENRKVLVPLWEKHNENGFQIVAYGLESSETAWNNAIQKDGAYRWTHYSHLEGDQNPFMDALRLKTIPANFLLDEEGRILAKNLHGEDLIEFVDNFMKEK